MQLQHTLPAPRHVAVPRLSRRAGLWAIAFAFLVASAFSTAPSALYGLYQRQQHLSPITITIIYAVYAAGVTTSLLLAGHVSDWYGRRAVLLPALAVSAAAALTFIFWHSLTGLVVARVLTGLALGATLATATAYITDLDEHQDPTRAGVVSSVASVGGLAVGPLVTGLLASYAPDALTLPYVVLLAGLVLGLLAVAVAPEGRVPSHPLPRYRPQRVALPAQARAQFLAATASAALAFAAWGLFAGLAGRFLAVTLHHPSPALTGAAIFLAFGAGIIVQTTTTTWSAHRLVVAGIPTIIAGLVALVASAWTAPPSLVLFLAGGVVTGLGATALFRASLGVLLSTARPEERAGALATFFVAGYAALSVPVLGLGIALQYLSPRVTLLLFGVVVGLGVLAAAPALVRQGLTPGSARVRSRPGKRIVDINH